MIDVSERESTKRNEIFVCLVANVAIMVREYYDLIAPLHLLIQLFFFSLKKKIQILLMNFFFLFEHTQFHLLSIKFFNNY